METTVVFRIRCQLFDIARTTNPGLRQFSWRERRGECGDSFFETFSGSSWFKEFRQLSRVRWEVSEAPGALASQHR